MPYSKKSISKKINFSFLLPSLLAVILITMVSCSKLTEISGTTYSVTPNPLELHSNKVTVNLSASIPPRVFPKDKALELVPFLVYGKDTSYFDAIYLQGEEYTDNHEVVPHGFGKSPQYTLKTEYKPEMKKVTFYIRTSIIANDAKKTKTKGGTIKLATGLIKTSQLVEDDDIVLLADDTYKAISDKTISGNVNFEWNSSYLKSSELRKSEIVEIKKIIKTAKKSKDLSVNSISFNSFASPEGKAKLNQRLSENRGSSSKKFVKKLTGKKNDKVKFDEAFQGADWSGFMKQVEKNPKLKPKDKEMIKRSLDETPLLGSKEKSIKSLSNTYPEIKNIIFPKLRRSEVVVSYGETAKTTEQIKELLKTSPEELSAEEFLHSAKLFNTLDEKLSIFKQSIKLFPNDFRTYNNTGAIFLLKENVDSAKNYIQTAYDMNKNDVTKNNLAIIKRKEKNIDEAIELLESTTEPKAKYNLGLIYLILGDYSYAYDNMSGFNSNNTALLNILKKDYDATINILENKENEDKFSGDPLSWYIKAIALVRKGENEKAKEALKKAISLDSSYEQKFKEDLEFVSLPRDLESAAKEPVTETK